MIVEKILLRYSIISKYFYCFWDDVYMPDMSVGTAEIEFTEIE